MDIYRCPKCGMEMTAKLWWGLGSIGKCPSGCGEFIDKFVKIDGKVAREREKGSRIAERLIDHGLKMLAKKGMIPVTMIHDGLLVTGKVTFEIDEKEEVLR